MSALVTDPPGGTVTTVALVLVLVGAFAKSAQVPFNFWLPGAMAAPTPVSAYLHSATMVKAGIVLVARLAPAFADQAPWRVLVVACGGASLLVGGVQALRQQDAKLALAQGTVSQLGLIMVLVGMGTPALTYAGVAVLPAHALFKAALFLVVGVVDHQAGTRDMRRLRHLGRRLPVLGVLAATAAASMAAIPPTFGFVAKESGLAALLDPGVGAVGAAALVLVVTGSVLTVAYSVRTVDGLFGRGTSGTTGGAAAGGEEPVGPDMVPRPGAAFLAAPAVLALLSLLCGLAAGAVGAFLAEVASSLDPASADGHLTLWPGIGAALGLSAATWVLGAVVATAVHRHEAGRDATTGIGARGYAALYDGLMVGARRITGVTQSGSLTAYLGVVLAAVVAAVAAASLAGPFDLGRIPLADSPLEVAAVALTIVLATGVLRARRRFSAALLLGGSGYGLAVLFLLHGAPDLAITQFLVETLTIVMFLLVLGRLPDRFQAAPTWAPRLARVGLSVGVGVVVTVFALAASGARTAPSVGDELLRRSEAEAGGRNVVNVTIVDFRGFDTLGEITVLGVAAIGVLNLVGAARREQRRKRLRDGVDLGGADTVAGDLPPEAGGPARWNPGGRHERRGPGRGRAAPGVGPAVGDPHHHGQRPGAGAPAGVGVPHLPRAQRSRWRVRRRAGDGDRGRAPLPGRRTPVARRCAHRPGVPHRSGPAGGGGRRRGAAVRRGRTARVRHLEGRRARDRAGQGGQLRRVRHRRAHPRPRRGAGRGHGLRARRRDERGPRHRPGPPRRGPRSCSGAGGRPVSVTLAVLIGVLASVGTYLVLQRTLTRIILGLGLLANAVNLLVLAAGGPPAGAPIIGTGGPLADPVPQALVLTAIVISFGITAFLLAVAYRRWTIDGNDDVEDDIEDRRIARPPGRTRAGRTAADERPAAAPGRRAARLVAALAVTSAQPAPRRPARASRSSCVGGGAGGGGRDPGVGRARRHAVRRRSAAGPRRSASPWSPTCSRPLMLVIGATMLSRCWSSPMGQRRRRRRSRCSTPTYLVLTAGVSAAFLTGDLFNLFVAVRDPAHGQLRAHHAGGQRRPDPLRHDLRGASTCWRRRCSSWPSPSCTRPRAR